MPEPHVLERMLRKVESRATLDASDRQALLDLPHEVRTLERSAYIVREGEPPTRSCLILSGFAFRQKLTSEGARQITSVHIPGEDMNFAFRVEGPAGVEYVRCFALDRDAGGILPADFARADLAPVGLYSLDDLSRIFRTLPAAQMSEATMVMTIEPQR